VIFSELTLELPGNTHPLYLLRDELKGAGENIRDLVRGNPNEHELIFPPDLLEQILLAASRDAQVYRPDPFGQLIARQAISSYYQNAEIPAAQIVLTPGTSISYWYCFKLLAEVGEEILCPQPSYPLLDYIARISGVNLSYYKLIEEKQWFIDLADLERKISTKTRAIVLISPHNPTGMVCSEKQMADLALIARERDLPIIADEVFSDFIFEKEILPRPATTEAPLVFTLNGLSKSYALPGIKLGWIGVSGDEWQVKRAMSALEILSDTFLPVSEISQFALPRIFQEGNHFQKHFKEWLLGGRNLSAEILQNVPFIAPEGGFYATVPVKKDEEELSKRILAVEKILLHPGHFYEMEGNHLVFTFVQKHRDLKDCLEKLLPFITF
jgi:aspartate/methionine/tyrosine aminotransferase